MNAKKEIIPFEASHPGTLIQDEIEFRGITQADLAMQLDVKKSFLNEIIKGKRALTADIALGLEKILEISAEYWMKLQSQFELDEARIKEKNIVRLANSEKWNIIKNLVPLIYLKKQNYLSDNIEKNIDTVKDIYSVSTIDQLVQKTANQHFEFHRKSEKLQIDDKNMLAWNMLAKYEVKNQSVNQFDSSNISNLLQELKTIFYQNNNTLENVKLMLNEFGIKFQLIEKIDKAPIDGFTFWSDENPAIAMTLRHKRLDNFAFTLMHEIGHIVLHLKNDKEKYFIDIDDKHQKSEFIEKEADTFSQESLISTEEWNEILRLPELNDYSINLMSDKFKIHPAIILGRINYEKNNYAIKTSIDKSLK